MKCCKELNKFINKYWKPLEPLHRFELRLSVDDFLWKLKEIYNRRLNHFNALSISQRCLNIVLESSTCQKQLFSKSNVYGIKQCEIYQTQPDIPICSNEKQSNRLINFIKKLRPIELLIYGCMVIEPSFIFDHQLEITDYEPHFKKILNIFINKCSNFVEKISFVNARYENNNGLFTDFNIKFNDISDHCKYKSTTLKSIKIENCDSFLVSLIFNHVDLTNICELCIDVESILCNNEDVVCQNWLSSGIKLSNLRDFSFTDSYYVATRIQDIGSDLITFILETTKKQLQKVAINQADQEDNDNDDTDDNKTIKDRFSVYKFILLQCSQLKTLQYSKGVPSSVYCTYTEDIFIWIVDFLEKMKQCNSFCLSLATYEAKSEHKDRAVFEALFAKYLSQFTKSLQRKTDGSYFIIAQIRQFHPHFEYKINPKIVSNESAYKIYDEFGIEITKNYQPHSHCGGEWYFYQSQTLTVIGPKCKDDMCIGDYRLQTDFSWNYCVFENQTSLQSYTSDCRYWIYREGSKLYGEENVSD